MSRATCLALAFVFAIVLLSAPAHAMRDPLNRNQPGGGYQDGMNLYQYVRSAPTRYVDPLGTRLFVVGGGAARQRALDTFLPLLEDLCPCLRFNQGANEVRTGVWVAVVRNTDNKDDFCACLTKYPSGCKVVTDLALDNNRHALALGAAGTKSRATPIRGRGDQRSLLVLDPTQGNDDIPLIQILSHELAHVWDYEHTFTGPNGTEPATGRTRDSIVQGLSYAEILAVRAENQIMSEITDQHVNRTIYDDDKNVPDPVAPRNFGKCDCDKLFEQLAP